MQLLIYAFTGRSHAQSVGPMAVTSLLTAATLVRLAEMGSANYLALAIWLALLSGAMLVLLGLSRLGFMADFLSSPVLAAFTSASAIIIVVSQLAPLAGFRAGGASLPQLLAGLLHGVGRVNPLALALGLSALLWLLLTRHAAGPLLARLGVSRRWAVTLVRAAPIVAVVAGMLVVQGAGLANRLPVVGTVPGGLPGLALPRISAEQFSSLILPAFFIALINYVQSLSVAQILATRRGETVDPDRELVALGLCNLGAGLFGGFPVTGGLTRSMVNADAGAHSQLASLPLAVLAATIVASVAGMVNFSALRQAWKTDRADAVAFVLTFALVLWLGVDSGIVAGMTVSLAAMLWRASRPHMVEVGRVPGTHHFRNRQRFNVERLPGVLFLRVDESLFFGNARQVRLAILRHVAESPETRRLVLIMSAVNRVDTSAVAMLEQLDDTLAAEGIRFDLAEVKGPVSDVLQRAGVARRFDGRIFLSTQSAWAMHRSLSPDYCI